MLVKTAASRKDRALERGHWEEGAGWICFSSPMKHGDKSLGHLGTHQSGPIWSLSKGETVNFGPPTLCNDDLTHPLEMSTKENGAWGGSHLVTLQDKSIITKCWKYYNELQLSTTDQCCSALFHCSTRRLRAAILPEALKKQHSMVSHAAKLRFLGGVMGYEPWENWGFLMVTVTYGWYMVDVLFIWLIYAMDCCGMWPKQDGWYMLMQVLTIRLGWGG